MDDLLAAFSGISMDDTNSVAKQFSRVLHVSEQDATFFLESCGGNIELAINMYLQSAQDSGGLVLSDSLKNIPPPAATFEGDITGVGNTLMQRTFAPLEDITMVWRFRNVGSHAWPNVDLVCSEGEELSFRTQTAPGVGPPPPGGTIDIEVHLTAPPAHGSAGGAFRLRSELHGYICDPIWVLLEVAGPAVATALMPPGQSGLPQLDPAPGMAMD